MLYTPQRNVALRYMRLTSWSPVSSWAVIKACVGLRFIIGLELNAVLAVNSKEILQKFKEECAFL